MCRKFASSYKSPISPYLPSLCTLTPTPEPYNYSHWPQFPNLWSQLPRVIVVTSFTCPWSCASLGLVWDGSNVGVTLWGCTAWSSWDCKTLCHFWGSGSHPFGALFLNIRETYRKTSGWFSSILVHFRLRRRLKEWGERLSLYPSNEEHDSQDPHPKNGRSNDWQPIFQAWLIIQYHVDFLRSMYGFNSKTMCKPLAFSICSMHGK